MAYARSKFRAGAFLLLLAASGSAAAQQYVPPGGFYIAGKQFSCGMVPTYLMQGMNDIAYASPQGILINWPQYSALPTAAQAFVYAHECAHELFQANENQADCWAAQIGAEQGFIVEADLEAICGSIWWSPGDWTHAPGPARCANISACLHNGS